MSWCSSSNGLVGFGGPGARRVTEDNRAIWGASEASGCAISRCEAKATKLVDGIATLTVL